MIELTVSWQRVLAAQKAEGALGYIQRSVGSRTGEGILCLCSRETPPGVLCSALGSPT